MTTAALSVACGAGESGAPVRAASHLALAMQPAAVAQSGIVLATQPVVQLQDQNGQPVPQAGVVVTATTVGGAGMLTNTTASTNASGAATFAGLTLAGTVGSYTLRFTAPGLIPVDATAPTVLSAGPPAQLAFGVQPGGVMAGAVVAPPVTVVVQDAQANTATGSAASISLAITNGTGSAGAVLSGMTSRPAASGGATFDDLAIDRSGTGFTLSASASGLAGATSASFDVSLAFRVVQGGGQTGIAGYELGDSLVVSAEDPVGVPRSGVPVQWAASGGALSGTFGITDAAGLARVAWRAAAGASTITAMAGGSQVTVAASGLAPGSCTFTGASNGAFPPRDTTRTLPTTRRIRAAALFIDFPDLPATLTVTETMNRYVLPAVAMLGATSDGALQYDVVPAVDWVRMPENAADFGWSDFLSQRAYIDSVLAREDATFDFASTDVVWIIRSSPNDPFIVSGTMNLSIGDPWKLPTRDGRELHNYITFGSDIYYVYPEWPDYGIPIIAHENGHTFGLTDLYAFVAADPVDGLRYTGGWSFMGWVAPATVWFAAERLYIGVLPVADALCPPAQPFAMVATLRPIEATTGLRAIGIRESAAQLVFLEVRQRLGLDASICATGLLAYDVDADVPGGSGPIAVREARASPAGPEQDRCGPKWQAPFQVGDVLALGTPDVTVHVVSEQPDGAMLVKVERR